MNTTQKFYRVRNIITFRAVNNFKLPKHTPIDENYFHALLGAVNINGLTGDYEMILLRLAKELEYDITIFVSSSNNECYVKGFSYPKPKAITQIKVKAKDGTEGLFKTWRDYVEFLESSRGYVALKTVEVMTPEAIVEFKGKKARRDSRSYILYRLSQIDHDLL